MLATVDAVTNPAFYHQAMHRVIRARAGWEAKCLISRFITAAHTELTRPDTRPTITFMENENFSDVAEQELRKLEFRVGELIQTVEHLKQENRMLREQNDVLTNERASLVEKNELARTKVEAIITRLRSMEDAVA
jgi:cell division protein ZapB